MIRILGISGSLRVGSYNTALLKAAAALQIPEVELQVSTLHGIALYDGDLEQRDGVPAAVRALKERIMANDAVILVTPEYNGGVPGVLKNALDWLSRQSSDIALVFADRPFAVIGASPGGFGTVLAQNAWLPVLRALGVRYWSGGRLLVSRAHEVFDGKGNMTSEPMREQLRSFVAGFAAFAEIKSCP